jgi:hypothetical protein
MRSDHRQALDRGVLMAQGGEFAFVLFAAASASGVIDAQVNASLTAIVVLSMVLTPLTTLAARKLLDHRRQPWRALGRALGTGGCRQGMVASSMTRQARPNCSLGAGSRMYMCSMSSRPW